MYLENTEASALPTFSLKMCMGSDLSSFATHRLMDRYKKVVDNPASQHEHCLSPGLCCRQADLARWNRSWAWLFLPGSTAPLQESWVGSISGMFLGTEQTQVATETLTPSKSQSIKRPPDNCLLLAVAWDGLFKNSSTFGTGRRNATELVYKVNISRVTEADWQ